MCLLDGVAAIGDPTVESDRVLPEVGRVLVWSECALCTVHGTFGLGTVQYCTLTGCSYYGNKIQGYNSCVFFRCLSPVLPTTNAPLCGVILILVRVAHQHNDHSILGIYDGVFASANAGVELRRDNCTIDSVCVPTGSGCRFLSETCGVCCCEGNVSPSIVFHWTRSISTPVALYCCIYIILP